MRPPRRRRHRVRCFIVQGTGGTFTTPFSDILSTSIKVPQGFNDLLITVSADTGLITNSSFANTIQDVGIDFRVLVDGNPIITPAPFVMWDDRLRFRRSLISGFVEDDLTLLGVRAFTFTQPNVGPGDHLVEVQARYTFLNIDSRFASSSTQAIVGPRTLVVEGVNLKFIAGNAWADAATKAATASSEVLYCSGDWRNLYDAVLGYPEHLDQGAAGLQRSVDNSVGGHRADNK